VHSGLPIIVLSALFSLGVTAEALRLNIGSKSAISLQWGPVVPKLQVERVAPHQPFFFSYGIKIWTDLSSVLSQFTRLTDGQTGLSSLDRVCIACSTVKIGVFAPTGSV